MASRCCWQPSLFAHGLILMLGFLCNPEELLVPLHLHLKEGLGAKCPPPISYRRILLTTRVQQAMHLFIRGRFCHSLSFKYCRIAGSHASTAQCCSTSCTENPKCDALKMLVRASTGCYFRGTNIGLGKTV